MQVTTMLSSIYNKYCRMEMRCWKSKMIYCVTLTKGQAVVLIFFNLSFQFDNVYHTILSHQTKPLVV